MEKIDLLTKYKKRTQFSIIKNMELENEISGVSKLFKENNVIVLGKRDNYSVYDMIDIILKDHQTHSSFYIVDLGEISRRYKKWTTLLPRVEPFYAVKCNPNNVICKLMALHGSGFDVASKYEINIVKDIVNHDKIIYAHPYKDCDYLQYARTVDVDLSVIDSENEIDKIKLLHPDCSLLVRIKVDDSHSLCRLNEKFGVDTSDLKIVENILSYAKSTGLNVIGVSFHVGSGCDDPSQYHNAIKLAKDVFDIGTKCGFTMNTLDIGGGFPGKNDDVSISLFENMCKVINDSIDEFFSDRDDMRFIAEPGRYFVQASHVLVVNVIGRNERVNPETGSKEYMYYINDGVYSSFNCIHFDHQKPEILPYNERNEKKYQSVIFGRTCDSIDKITDNIQLPKLVCNDYLFVDGFGAYTVAASSTFNGFPEICSYYIMTS